MKIQQIFYILFGVFIHSSFAQEISNDSQAYYTYRLDVDDGLSQSNANCIVKDHEGFIWIGTDDGLNRFDGYDFKTFYHDPNDSLTLEDDKVLTLYEDSQNRLWVGTNIGGLNLYDRHAQTFKKYLRDPDLPNSISNNTITSIYEDSKGRLWVGTLWGLNLFVPEKEEFLNFYHRQDGGGIANNEIQGISEKNGKIWVATRNGLSTVDLNDFSTANILQNKGPAIDQINTRLECLLIDSKENVWLGTNGLGLVKYSESSDTFEEYPIIKKTNLNTSNIILALHEDDNGNLLIASDGGGLFSFNPNNGRFSQIESNNDRSFHNSAIYSLFLDNDDILWTGIYGGGVTLVNKKSKGFTNYDSFNETMESFGKNSVLSFAEDHQNNIWIGTDGAGLYRFNPKNESFTAYVHDPDNKNSISGNVIKSLLVDNEGNLYAGTYAAGLNYINLKTNKITRFSPEDYDTTTLQTEHVWDIFQDSDGRIWIGQLRGFCEYLPKKKIFKRYKIDIFDSNSLGSMNITRIYEDKNNNLWVGTEEGGIALFDKENEIFKTYRHNENNLIGLSNNEVKEIFEDRDGTLWVGTNGGGLNYYDRELDDFIWLKSNSGLSDEVLSVLEDKNGNFWIGTFNGLAKYDPATDVAKYYTKSDGIQSNEFNYDAKLKSSDGTYYFGGLNGFIKFRPENITDYTTTPDVVLTDLYLFHDIVKINDQTKLLKRDINTLDKIALTEDQNVLTFWYSALDYNFPKKNEYAYILEGFDQDWNYVGENRSATYTNLPPGEYTFKVIASNNEGYWNERGKELQIVITPPWYKIPWVVLLLMVLFAMLLIAAFKLRTHMYVVQKRNLELQVRRRTLQIDLQKKELQKQNKKIVSQNEELIHKNEEIEAQHFQIEEKSNLLYKAHEELKLANDELKKANTELEKIVDKRTEELRETIQQLMKTDEELSTFLYRSSHDLRGPIVTLIGLSQLGNMEIEDEKSKKYFEKINRACTHMLDFLKQLNDTNVIFRSLKTSVKINWLKIFTEINSDLQRIDPDNRVRKEIDLRIDHVIYSDELMMKTILKNLLENSIIFSRRTDPYVKLTLTYKDQHLIMTILDNGIGIDDSIQNKIYDMFFRGTEVSKGNGLGLYLVQKAVDVLEGEIMLKSKKMEFTEFVIEIPIEKIEFETSKAATKELAKIFVNK